MLAVDSPGKMILLAGRGIAALVCAQQLAHQGCSVICYGPPRQEGPTVLLGYDTLALLRSLFPAADLTALGHPIQGRDVRWGDDPLTQLSAPACAVSLSSLVNHLEPALLPSVTLLTERPQSDSDALWQIDATGRQAHLAAQIAGVPVNSFGQRCMATLPVELKSCRCDRVGMESIPSGWMFLCPTSSHNGVLQVMLPQAPLQPERAIQVALSQSQLIAEQLVSFDLEALHILPAAPQILTVLGSDRWLAVGAAACTFDPVCGDGIGQAIRSALLASAVLLSGSEGIPLTDAIRHYHLRHRHTFAWHLRHIYNFYKPLLTQPIWFEELIKTQQFLASHAAYNLLHQSQFAYRLKNLALTPNI